MDEKSCSNGFHIDEDGEMSLYRKDATSVVFFKIVYGEDDVTSKSDVFKPVMAHQIFGDSESIFGYRSLAMNIYYLHNSARCYVDIQKSMEIKKSEIYKPDNIMHSLEPWLPSEFTANKSEFKKMIENEKHDLIFGRVLAEFKDEKQGKLISDQNVQVNYKITKCDITDENFQRFHSKFETFIVWYIDAANPIDLTDDRWMLYYVYEEFEHPVTNEIYRSAVGYCSVYKFYAYPDNIRARISQFFILPPHQRKGIGSKLYHTIINDIKKMPKVIDVTVEEPTPHFQKIRDFEDCTTIYKELNGAGIDICSTNTKKIFGYMKKEKICKRQCQRVYDILCCYKASKLSQVDYKKSFTDIKNRITADIERETRGSKRICNLERAGIFTEPTDRKVLIETEYKRYIDDIKPSIKNLQKNFG
ncbi:histone acetyltransferase type B catalytic subunit [Anoplophora glabripennis]|uniref:histone acetyltransferase type B catalytic subunit n=1 Tax=Anoplophora glabripennis TaxID=217634 RepID=UPI000874AFF2|nr:histone acetyltransferase type B catalytic subunit [Anoplophora glabripennis]